MTLAEARTLAQSDPTENLASRIGELKTTADRQVADLIRTLTDLDHTTRLLTEKGLGIVVDLGPIGNAAAAARRDLEKQKPHTFEMPKAS